MINDDGYKEKQGILAYHERVRSVKVGGYTVMKKQTFQGVFKSPFILMNGGKIFKWWWLWQRKWGGLMNMVTGGRMVEVKKRYLCHC
jgi:hypothetical protein